MPTMELAARPAMNIITATENPQQTLTNDAQAVSPSAARTTCIAESKTENAAKKNNRGVPKRLR